MRDRRWSAYPLGRAAAAEPDSRSRLDRSCGQKQRGSARPICPAQVCSAQSSRICSTDQSTIFELCPYKLKEVLDPFIDRSVGRSPDPLMYGLIDWQIPLSLVVLADGFASACPCQPRPSVCLPSLSVHHHCRHSLPLLRLLSRDRTRTDGREHTDADAGVSLAFWARCPLKDRPRSEHGRTPSSPTRPCGVILIS